MTSPARGGYALWVLAVATSRLPVAMTPLTLLFLGSQTYGSYGYGLLLVGLYVAAEACFAPVLGARLSATRFRRESALGLALTAGAYAAIAALDPGRASLAWPLTLASGAGAAAVPGALRVAVTNVIDDSRVRRAFSVETALTMSCWAAAPALVAAISFATSPRVVLLGCCALTTASAVVVLRLVEAPADPAAPPRAHHHGPGRRRTLLAAWPAFACAALAMSLASFFELLLPALLEERGEDPARSGVLLSLIALSGLLGAGLYGVVRIPGHPAAQSWACLAGMTLAVAALAYARGLPVLVPLLCALGLGQAVCLVARNLALRTHLPQELHVMGFAVVYSLSGLGYGISAGGSALALRTLSAQTTIALGAALVGVLTILTWYAARRGHDTATRG